MAPSGVTPASDLLKALEGIEIYSDLSRLEIKKRKTLPSFLNLNSLPQSDLKSHAEGIPHASGDPQEELEEPSLIT